MNAENFTSDIVTCYVPKSKGGYLLSTQTTLTNNMGMTYTLNRLSTGSITNSNGFSLFNNDVEQLNVMITMNVENTIRMKITGKKYN